jgi:hypothetical protein
MTIAIVGRTGSGKSYSAKGLIEPELESGARVCVIDPTGAWWGLRLRPDGVTPAFPVVIFGGDHADVPIAADQGERLADVVVDGRAAQSVVDVSDMSTGEQIRFLTPFLERLYTRNRTPLTLVMDEADLMAPQQGMPEQMRLKGATNKIVRRGRIKGFRPIMITQRPAVLDKSVLSQIDTLIAMRLTSPQDRKAIEEWVKGNADEGEARRVLGTLASLKRGDGWFWAPHDDVLERRAFPAIKTFDSSRAPEAGETPRDISPAALADLDGLRAAFAPSATEKSTSKYNSKNNDGADLVEAETRGFAKGVQAAAAHIRHWTLIYSRSPTAGERELTIHDRSPIGHLIAGEIETLLPRGLSVHLAPAAAPMSVDTASANGNVVRACSRSMNLLDTVAQPPRQFDPAQAKQDMPPIRRRAAKAVGVVYNSAARKMLDVLDTNPPVRRSWTQVATLAGLKARGGHFNAGRKELVDSGMLAENGGLVSIISPSKGAAFASVDPAALVELWAASLSGAAPKILRSLFQAKGRLPRSAIADRLGMQPRGGHWNAAWKELRDNEIVSLDGDVATLTELFRVRDEALKERG